MKIKTMIVLIHLIELFQKKYGDNNVPLILQLVVDE